MAVIDKDRPKRKNGFMCPPSFHQILTFILLIGNKVIYSLFIYPLITNLNHIDLLVITIVCFVLLILTIGFGFQTTLIDPEDPIVVEQLNKMSEY